MNPRLLKIFQLYNNTASYFNKIAKNVVNLITFNLGSMLKTWCVDNNLKNLSLEEKNNFATKALQIHLSRIANKSVYQQNKICDQEWKHLFDQLTNHDDFLHQKLLSAIGKEDKEVIDLIIEQIKETNLYNILSLKFKDFTNKISEFVREYPEKHSSLTNAANKINNISYPLTEEYFIYYHVAKAVIRYNKRNLIHNLVYEIYEQQKQTHLDFVNYLKSLEASISKIKTAENQFENCFPCISKTIEKSNEISKHAGKIALAYVTAIAGVISLRHFVIDEENPWYEFCALPTTLLAMLQIVLSFPGAILSVKKAQEINNNIFKDLYKNSPEIDIEKINNIKFLLENTPTFSNKIINLTSICFRYSTNLLLQPIDLLNNDLVNHLISATALRWSAAAGVMEEQSKVTSFMHGKLVEFLYKKIAPALIKDEQIQNRYIDNYFKLLNKYMQSDTAKQKTLKEIYIKLTKEKMDFDNDNDNANTSIYKNWQLVTTCSAAGILFLDYLFFYLRDPNVNFYEDPVFYCSTSVKLTRLGSLLLSTWYGSKLTKIITEEKLDNDLCFQKLYYNDVARLISAMLPLIMFESIKNLKFLSLATLLDVLTTTISDLSVSKAISRFIDFNTQELAITLGAVSSKNINIDEVQINISEESNLLGSTLFNE